MRSAFSTSRPPESLRRARPRPGPAGAPLWPRRGRAASDRGALEPVRRRHGTRFGRGWDEGGLQAQVENLRLPGRTVLPIVLSWVRPDAFPPPRACTPETPVLDPKKTAKLLDAYGAHLLLHRSRRSDPPGCPMFSSSMETRKRTMLQPCCPTRLQRAIICCSRDTSSTLTKRCSRLPRRSKKRRGMLSDRSSTRRRPLIERICRFEAETARLFEQHRALVANAVPRRSSPRELLYGLRCTCSFGNPDRHPLYSPRRLKALDQATGYGCSYRIAHPESVTRFAELCEALKPALRGWIGVPGRRPDSAGAELRMTTNADSSRDAELNLLIEELALFACARTPA